VENQHGGRFAVYGAGRVLGLDELGVHARAAHAREIQVVAFGEARLEAGGAQFDLRVRGGHLREPAFPVRVEILRFRVQAAVLPQFLQRHVQYRHVCITLPFVISLRML